MGFFITVFHHKGHTEMIHLIGLGVILIDDSYQTMGNENPMQTM
jgi:hypothetical protein